MRNDYPESSAAGGIWPETALEKSEWNDSRDFRRDGFPDAVGFERSVDALASGADEEI